jgi:hypothetical protein
MSSVPSSPTGVSAKYVLTNTTWRSSTSLMSKSRSRLWATNTNHPSIMPASSKAAWKALPNPSMRSSQKKRPGDHFPKYFVCTDTTLTVQQALRIYQKRWPVEVDNTYLKNALGLGDFRQQSFESTQKWFAVVMLAINYLQYQMALAYSKNLSKSSLADFICQHRLEHFQKLLHSVLQPFVPAHQIEACLQDVFSASPLAIL